MYFVHSDIIWSQFSQLRALAVRLRYVDKAILRQVDLPAILTEAREKIDATQESEIASIQAWRRAYSAMGMKPTQYRCAAEALLRRLRKERTLPNLHPLIDVLNAESAMAAIPIAAFDVRQIVDSITVKPAKGDEVFETFQGEAEAPEPGEIIFADSAGQAHSRRWVFRQSAVSAVKDSTRDVLLIAEALHDAAADDLAALEARLRLRFAELGVEATEFALLDPSSRQFDFVSAN